MARRLLLVVILVGAVLEVGPAPSAHASTLPWIATFVGEAGASCFSGFCTVTADAPTPIAATFCKRVSENLPTLFLSDCTFSLTGTVNFLNLPEDACSGLGSGTATIRAGTTTLSSIPVTIVVAAGTMTWVGLDLSRVAVTTGTSYLVCSRVGVTGINMAGVFTGPANI